MSVLFFYSKSKKQIKNGKKKRNVFIKSFILFYLTYQFESVHSVISLCSLYCYSSGNTKCAFPTSSPSIKMFCPVQKRVVTVIKYAHLQNQLSVLPLSLDEFHIFLNLVAAHRVPATDISSAAYS